MRQPRSEGFTLIEIMLVVIILAILAMVIIPRLSDASDDSRDKSLQADLGSLQRQIGHYRFDHGGRGPHMNPDKSIDNSGANFIARMTGKTDSTGALNPTGACGPYFREWPANPFIANVALTAQVKIGSGRAPRDGATGWWFDVTSQTITPSSALGALEQFPR
ncbi:MAG: prepilin-type N-terminal cleavage/methylation domain-containing protein [Planctomycetota bacterium]|nr:prepilin-type N-terminal cleavage/methylation domain-containing protein [Planctomycetota bacterium]